MWKSDELIICILCAGFSSHSTRLLKHTCRRRRSAYGDNNIKRVFEQGLHPIYDKHVPHPELWLICKPLQDTRVHLENAISLTEPAAERGSVTVRFLDELAKEITLMTPLSEVRLVAPKLTRNTMWVG